MRSREVIYEEWDSLLSNREPPLDHKLLKIRTTAIGNRDLDRARIWVLWYLQEPHCQEILVEY